jgi:TatD DNase family protein
LTAGDTPEHTAVVLVVDAHTHLDFDDFAPDRAEVVARARAAGVAWWVICGSDHERWDRTALVARQTGGIAAIGVHPWAAAAEIADAEVDRWVDAVRAAIRAGTARILGEIGLDALWYPDDAAPARQRRMLRDQLAVARELDVPVVLHCVRAYPELLALVERDGLPRAGGMLHAWTGHPDQVERALRLGLYVSFGPTILRDRAVKARSSVPLVPDDRLLVETDCPAMAPVGIARGEPAHVVEVAAAAAALRGQPVDELARRTTANAERLFGPARQKPP